MGCCATKCGTCGTCFSCGTCVTLFFETRIKFVFCTRGVRDILVLDSIALRYVYYILIGCLLIPREYQIKINVVYFYKYIFYNITMNTHTHTQIHVHTWTYKDITFLNIECVCGLSRICIERFHVYWWKAHNITFLDLSCFENFDRTTW